ncbi:MAG: glycosyltransferase family 9 protein [Candidatus Omnitrophota bacterium]
MRIPKKILIFELNWLGDILFSFPFLRAVRQAFPRARIICAVVPRYKDLLINVPWIDGIRILADKNGVLSLCEKIEFIRTIRKEKYDACFLLKPSKTKTIMARLAGIPDCYSGRNNERFLTRQSHRADTLLGLVKDAGVRVSDNTYEYFISEKDKQEADKILYAEGEGRRVIVVNVGGNWPAKRWPLDRFTELIKRLLDRFEDVEVALSGAKKDIEVTEKIKSEVDDKRCYSLAGKTTLNELAAVFQKSSLMISADSGPLHLASAAGNPIIGLFGPTSREITGPRGKGRNIIIQKEIDCEIPCYIESCEKDYLCMRSITVNEVFAAAEESLRKK